MCACSKKRMPLVMLKGMLRRVSSSCSFEGMKVGTVEDRHFVHVTPSSRSSRTRWAMKAACSVAVPQVTSTGFAPDFAPG